MVSILVLMDSWLKLPYVAYKDGDNDKFQSLF